MNRKKERKNYELRDSNSIRAQTLEVKKGIAGTKY